MPERGLRKRKISVQSQNDVDTRKKTAKGQSESQDGTSTPGSNLPSSPRLESSTPNTYYPNEMSDSRAKDYKDGELPRPIDELASVLDSTLGRRKGIAANKSVVHWFKMDLRTKDNRALALASDFAQTSGVPLIGLYIISPQDYKAHLRAPVRVDFMLRTLKVLRKDLDSLDIPLAVHTVTDRAAIPDRILALLNQWGSNHLFANMEYEVDELRREAAVVQKLAANGIAADIVHDTCVVPPGLLQTGSGKQYAVYTPWFKAWRSYIGHNQELLHCFDAPAKNPAGTRKDLKSLFDANIPETLEGKELSVAERKKFRLLWPAGEHEAESRLEEFCEEKIGSYREHRNIPSLPGTSCLSVHLASGTISARTCVQKAREYNNTKKIDGGNEGIQTWISEVAWRDFYRHVLANWPYVW
jgi:deoxyribodipyrimidine photo-lyase